MNRLKCGDFNLYFIPRSGSWCLEVYGIGGELVEKLYFSSAEAARYHILKHY
jgi:hypothetical protein